ncbi:MAG: type II/IV secretion system ATPase subunit [Thermoplasmata archaeon]|nr:type II/IV secretion system ATPase subunit [Thermoplasmata archaeon]
MNKDEESGENTAVKRKPSLLFLSPFKKWGRPVKVPKSEALEVVMEEVKEHQRLYEINKKRLKGLKIVNIPPVDESVWEVAQPLKPIRWGYSYIRILRNKKTREYLYEVIEPILNMREKKIYRFLYESFIERVNINREEDDIKSEEIIREKMQEFLDEAQIKIDRVSFEKIFYHLRNELLGFGKIQILMDDRQLEDISCDGVNIPIYVFHRQYKNVKTNLRFTDASVLDEFVLNLAQRSGKSISIANPILDATLPDGSRLNATYGSEITTRGSSFTIRKFREDPLTIVNLILFKTLSPEMAAHLWLAVQYGDSIMISGGTASGKTTTMNAISHFIPPSSKIITIEDTREIQLPHENWIAGLTRERKGDQVGSNIDMYALLVAALRQRPEYMIVGEVRGRETMAVFQAMATGQVCYATIHADSVASIVHRLENPPINIPRILILGLNLVVLQAQVRVRNRRTRRIKELTEIIGIEPVTNEIVSNVVYRWNPAKDDFRFSGHSRLYEKIMDIENMTTVEILGEVKRRAEVLRWMAYKGLKDYRQVAQIVNEYYRDPETLWERVSKELPDLRAKRSDLKYIEPG